MTERVWTTNLLSICLVDIWLHKPRLKTKRNLCYSNTLLQVLLQMEAMWFCSGWNNWSNKHLLFQSANKMDTRFWPLKHAFCYCITSSTHLILTLIPLPGVTPQKYQEITDNELKNWVRTLCCALLPSQDGAGHIYSCIPRASRTPCLGTIVIKQWDASQD